MRWNGFFICFGLDSSYLDSYLTYIKLSTSLITDNGLRFLFITSAWKEEKRALLVYNCDSSMKAYAAKLISTWIYVTLETIPPKCRKIAVDFKLNLFLPQFRYFSLVPFWDDMKWLESLEFPCFESSNRTNWTILALFNTQLFFPNQVATQFLGHNKYRQLQHKMLDVIYNYRNASERIIKCGERNCTLVNLKLANHSKHFECARY